MTRDFSEQLHGVVEAVLEEYDLDAFEDYWDLGRRILANLKVRRFYVQAEPGYANIAILTDGLVVDVEGDDNDDTGWVSVRRLSDLSGLTFYQREIPTLADSVGAQLVVTAESPGSDDIGMYWTAKTDQEEESLTLFGEALIQAIDS